MRLFIGIDLPKAVKEELLGMQKLLKDLGISASWKDSANFHLTLEFLGELDGSMVPLLIETMKRSVANREVFSLSVEGIGGFPNLKRPHTLWTDLRGDLPLLHALRDDVHQRLVENGFPVEERKFSPHITLCSRPLLQGADLSCLQGKLSGRFTVLEVILFESRSDRSKRVYNPLYSASLNDRG